MLQTFTKPLNRARALSTICILIIIFSMVLPATFLVQPVKGVGNLYIAPVHIDPKPSDSIITYTVQVSAMDSFNGWDILVKTTQTIIDPLSVSISGNVLGKPFQEVINCVNNGVGIPSGQPGSIGCDITDGPGLVHSAAAFSGFAPDGTNGLLFTINYKVQSIPATVAPYSSVDPARGCITNGSRQCVTHTTTSGEYGTPPGIKPVPIFTWKPLQPFGGQKITFNATQSYDPNPGHRIISYTWNLADQKIDTVSIPYYNYSFVATGGSPLIGNFTVTLTVIDDLGLADSIPHIIEIKNLPFHDIAVQEVRVSLEDGIIAGTPVNIWVIVSDKGTFQEKGFNLTVLVENQVFKTYNYTNGLMTDQRVIDGPVTWDTTGKPLGIYEIRAELMPLRAANGTIIENNNCPTHACLTDNVGYHLVRISSPQGASQVSLSMVQSFGLILGVLAAGGAAWSIVGGRNDKRKRKAAEALP